jgi:hypothetical protein
MKNLPYITMSGNPVTFLPYPPIQGTNGIPWPTDRNLSILVAPCTDDHPEIRAEIRDGIGLFPDENTSQRLYFTRIPRWY